MRTAFSSVGICRLLSAFGLLLLCSAALHAAPQVGPLGPGAHGIAFAPEGGAKDVYALQVIATSKTPGSVKPAELPADLAGRIRDTQQGAYVREEWDKGALLTDNWSARWTGTLKVDQDGEYTFYLTTDDGARMKLDGKTIIDAWAPRPPTTSEVKVQLAAGNHEVVVEYFEAGGGAVAKLEWSADGINRQPVPTDRVSSGGQPGWRAEYFPNPNLEGQPFVGRAPMINDDWGEGGPKVGDEEPGSVCLDWTRIGPNAVVGRVHSDPKTNIGLTGSIGPGASGRLNWRLINGPGEEMSINGVVWPPPTEASYLFIAGFDPLPEVTLTETQEVLRDAATAGIKPNLPPYPKDAEGWVTLFNGTDKSGWKMRGGADNWKVEDGLLRNVSAGSDIYTEWTFTDFDLHVEFRVPPSSNSGVYLQGNYEIQVDDCFGQPLRDTMCGAVYHRITPTENAAKKAGEWNTFDVSFLMAGIDDNGRYIWPRITLVFNGTKTIDDKPIEGLTGSAMSDRLLAAGPLMFQGDHGPVDYRNVKIRPK